MSEPQVSIVMGSDSFVAKAGLAALAQTQTALAEAVADFGVSDEDQVQSMVDDTRGRVP